MSCGLVEDRLIERPVESKLGVGVGVRHLTDQFDLLVIVRTALIQLTSRSICDNKSDTKFQSMIRFVMTENAI